MANTEPTGRGKGVGSIIQDPRKTASIHDKTLQALIVYVLQHSYTLKRKDYAHNIEGFDFLKFFEILLSSLFLFWALAIDLPVTTSSRTSSSSDLSLQWG